MSVPDTLNYLKSNMIFYSRQSELEINPILYQTTHGIWLDAFDGYYTQSLPAFHSIVYHPNGVVEADINLVNFFGS